MPNKRNPFIQEEKNETKLPKKFDKKVDELDLKETAQRKSAEIAGANKHPDNGIVIHKTSNRGK